MRSNFSGPPIGTTIPPPATPGPNAPQGFFAAGDGDVLLAVIVAMMVIDGVSWATERIRQAFAQPAEPPVSPAATEPAARRPMARPPGYSWVFMYP